MRVCSFKGYGPEEQHFTATFLIIKTSMRIYYYFNTYKIKLTIIILMKNMFFIGK